MMTFFEIVTIIIACSALIVSITAVFFNGLQTRKATEAMRLQQQIERGNTVQFFTSRFFDLCENCKGNIYEELKEDNWAYQFWSLLSTEFYFFHHGILPVFMYKLWMIDLARVYSGEKGKEIRDSHIKYLNVYSLQYTKMTDFFERVDNIANKESRHESSRNRKIVEFVDEWIYKHKRNILL